MSKSIPSNKDFNAWNDYFDSQDTSFHPPLSDYEDFRKMYNKAHILIGFAITLIALSMITTLPYCQEAPLTAGQKVFFVITNLSLYAFAGTLVCIANQYLKKDYDEDPHFRKLKRRDYLREFFHNGLFAAELRYIKEMKAANGKKNPAHYQTFSEAYFPHGVQDIITMLSSKAFTEDKTYKKLCKRPQGIILDSVREKTTSLIVSSVLQNIESSTTERKR